jgi:nitroreductase
MAGSAYRDLVERTELLTVIEYAGLAPSVHNTQPWSFSLSDNAVEVRADRRRGLAVLDPRGRQLTISCGAALEFAYLAVRGLGRDAAVRSFPHAGDRDSEGRPCAVRSARKFGQREPSAIQTIGGVFPALPARTKPHRRAGHREGEVIDRWCWAHAGLLVAVRLRRSSSATGISETMMMTAMIGSR